MSNEYAPDSRQSVDLKWKLRKALEKNVAPRDDGKGLDFGQDVGIDGKLHLNELSDIVGPTGAALFTDSTQENVSSEADAILKEFFVGRFAGGAWVGGAGEGNTLLNFFQSIIATGKCTDFVDCFSRARFFARTEVPQSAIYLADLPENCVCDGMFDAAFLEADSPGVTSDLTLVLGNGSTVSSRAMFSSDDAGTGIKHLTVAEGKSFKMKSSCRLSFYRTALISISGIDFSEATDFGSTFASDSQLTSIDCTGFKVSFDVSQTGLEHDALVTLIDSLETVTRAQTLTMGDEKLALLSDEEKLGATNKGWTLA